MSPVPAINHGSGQCTKAKAVAEIRMQPKAAKKWRNRRSCDKFATLVALSV